MLEFIKGGLMLFLLTLLSMIGLMVSVFLLAVIYKFLASLFEKIEDYFDGR